jgi:hypothetical protein
MKYSDCKEKEDFMMEKKRNAIPKKDEYKVKYVFKEDSNIDINNVIKECFAIKIKTANLQKITQ